MRGWCVSELYTKLAAVALSQIQDKGRTVTLTTPGVDVYNPAAGTFTPGTATTQTPKALFTNFTLKEIDGDLIRSDDKKCLIAATALTAPPTNKDTITDGSDVYQVLPIEQIKPGDTAIVYILRLRR